MRHKICFLLLVIITFSCCLSEKKESVNFLLLFGHSGFCLKDSLNHIYPSTDWRYKDSLKLEIDSSRFDIRQYFEYKRDSFIGIAVRRPGNLTEYHKINREDTLGFQDLINSTLINKTYKWNYNHLGREPWLYHGWYYTLYYETSFRKKFFIRYTPAELPGKLRKMHDSIVSVILKKNPVLTDKFEYHSITRSFAESRIKYSFFPPLPQPYRVKHSRYKGN